MKAIVNLRTFINQNSSHYNDEQRESKLIYHIATQE